MKTLKQPWIIRLVSCMGGGLVLALMYGPQEGTINADFGSEDGVTTLEVEVLKDKNVSKVVVAAETGKVLKVKVADAEDGENGGEND